MNNSSKIRTVIFSLVITALGIGFTFAHNKVVVIPLESDNSSVSPGIPAGMVSAFNRQTCPAGWGEYIKTRGRSIIGLQLGGELEAVGGLSLSDKESRTHSHEWSSFDGTDKIWKTYDQFQTQITLVDWGDGTGTDGSGYYPVAVHSPASYLVRYHTKEANSTHPYVQLLYCEKL